MSVIEAELVKIFKFKKSPDDFEDHQEYLSELVLCVEKIKDEKIWDAMQEETYDWLTEAVDAKNKKNEIPDFPDAEPEEPEPGEPEAPNEDEEMPLTDPNHPLHRASAPKEDGDEEDEPTEVDEETPEEEAEVEGEEGTEGESEGEPDPETVVGEVAAGEITPDAAVEDAAPAKKPRKKPVKAGKYIKKTKGKPDIEPKHKPGKEPNYKAITGKKNRYGVTEGTKSDLAIKMFEKGHTMRDVNIELGDNYYVLLRKLVGRGHRVEKLENKVLKLIYKDDIGKKAKGK